MRRGNRADLDGNERNHHHKQPPIDELVKRQMAQLEAWSRSKRGSESRTR